TNIAGQASRLSSNAVLTVLPATAPTATTLAATGLTANSATANANINPMGAPTVAWFDYGLTAAYGNRTVPTNVGQASNAIPFAQVVTGLATNTTYHYRVVATNYGGMALGADLTFQTAAPTVGTDPFYSFREVTIPGAVWTRVNGINNLGDLVGQYFD